MRILIDMNLSPLWVQFFADHNIESIHCSQLGLASSSDLEVLAYAAERKLVVFTNDLDFGVLLAMSRRTAPSVIQVRTQDVLPHALGPTLLVLLRELADHVQSGAIVSVDPGRNRIHFSPDPLKLASL